MSADIKPGEANSITENENESAPAAVADCFGYRSGNGDNLPALVSTASHNKACQVASLLGERRVR